MSIVYDALKKVESQKTPWLLKSIRGSISEETKPPLPLKEKKASLRRKTILFSSMGILIVLSSLFLSTKLTKPGRELRILTPGTLGVKQVSPAEVYVSLEPGSEASREVVLEEELVTKYTLEGIVYDREGSFAIINGRVKNELDELGDFRIDKISEDTVEMSSIKDNRKLTLSLPY
ncbi:MAG: hypothetical protein ABIE75_02715 [Candidatus Omnitrophota bacterium]